MHTHFIAFILLLTQAIDNHTTATHSSNTLFINSNGTSLHRLDFSKDGSPLIGYQVNATGAYTIECSPQGTATNLLRGTANGMSGTGVSYPISGSDTIYIKNASTHAVVETIILEPSDGDPFKIIYGAKTNASHTLNQTRDAINSWINTTMTGLRFERVY